MRGGLCLSLTFCLHTCLTRSGSACVYACVCECVCVGGGGGVCACVILCVCV